MRIKENYVLRKIADTWMVLPLAEETLDFSSLLALNDSGAMLWQVLEKQCDIESLVEALVSEYKVSAEQAEIDAQEFLNKLIQAGCIET